MKPSIIRLRALEKQLYAYLYAMTVSSAYGLAPILGGALYMSGAVATAFAQTFFAEARPVFERLCAAE